MKVLHLAMELRDECVQQDLLEFAKEMPGLDNAMGTTYSGVSYDFDIIEADHPTNTNLLNKEDFVKAVRNMMETQTFFDWYNSKFADYLQEDYPNKRKQVEKDLSRMLGV